MGEPLKSEVFQMLETEIEDLGGYAAGPERGLLSALLFDGVQSYLAHCLSPTETMKTKYIEAYQWVHRTDQEYIFSFDNVCEALGVDPDGLRLGLANFINSNQLESYRRARRQG